MSCNDERWTEMAGGKRSTVQNASKNLRTSCSVHASQPLFLVGSVIAIEENSAIDSNARSNALPHGLGERGAWLSSQRISQ